jgi:hypothetical protein
MVSIFVAPDGLLDILLGQIRTTIVVGPWLLDGFIGSSGAVGVK